MARRFPWIYAPALYEVRYGSEGAVQSVNPKDETIPAAIERCQTPDFECAPFPIRPLVPYTEVVHDRIAIEIMRGCPQRCRFCHAGYTKRPVRIRSVDKILEMAERMYRSTGFNELGLLSLSTADYPHLPELAQRADETFAKRHVNISVPSLRVDKMLQHIPRMVNTVRKSGLTMAVEAANDDVRAAILKRVTNENLLDGARQAYQAGWRSVKLYFMCGFPGERPEDIDGIVHLSREVGEARREFGKGPARVNVSVAWLVPKPFTPLQWFAQPEAEYFHEARRRITHLLGKRRGTRKAGGRGPIRFKTHSVERSVLEAVFARGDRRLSDVIECAYNAGARFDGWDECFRPAVWEQAFDATGVDPCWYAHRERPPDEVLPWSHLRSGPPEEYLLRQYQDVVTRIGAARNVGPMTPDPKARR
jgi:radical SAM superfamily enzyme YgiQ (UPF0313 family)